MFAQYFTQGMMQQVGGSMILGSFCIVILIDTTASKIS